MKKLIMIRHGKSDWSDIESSDFNRPLADRGYEEAVLLGDFIIKNEGIPEFILSSSAKRAQDTIFYISKNMDIAFQNFVYDDNLYLAPYQVITKVIAKTDDNIHYLVLCGHNPGLTDLINHLGVSLDDLPTAAAICFEFDTDNWSQINKDNAQFKWFQIGKKLL